MNKRLQTGTARKSIKSYKPLMAELNVPQFLTRGDSAFFLGKVLNYSQDKSITGKVKWVGAQTDFEKNIQFTEFHMDKLPVHAITLDSIKTSYRFTRDDGYLDGEERTIPVVEQGVMRAAGTLSILKNNEDVHVKASANENVTIEILSSQVDIYAGEARYLLHYKYACNEQLASKLLGLINHKLLMQYEGKSFKYDKDVNNIIARLLKNQNEEFLWSWWDVSSNVSYWMSAHILRALKVASDAGYKVDLDIGNVIRKAEYKFDMLHKYSLSDVDLLHALACWKANLNYAKHIGKLDSIVKEMQTIHNANILHYYHYHYSLLKEKLLLLETRQITNLPYQRDSLLQYKVDGIMGDMHFSDKKPAHHWYDDELASNAIAYRIVKGDSLLKYLQLPMQMYFLSQRRQGEWNTYHSSNVLTSVLPDLIAGGASKNHQATVTLSGKVNAVVGKFPYRLEVLPAEELNIHKDSGLPLYYMQYINERVTKAKTGVAGFKIKTSLSNDQVVLPAGKPVALTVEVELTKDASVEYVMIEVPIPGACSYADKTQVYNGIETHREYFKDRTVIFCENMKKGRYTFVVHLLPRFTGKYLINPAQVSLMYVPVVNANTDMKTITVK
jgi:alpha-2-macroglobulin